MQHTLFHFLLFLLSIFLRFILVMYISQFFLWLCHIAMDLLHIQVVLLACISFSLLCGALTQTQQFKIIHICCLTILGSRDLAQLSWVLCKVVIKLLARTGFSPGGQTGEGVFSKLNGALAEFISQRLQKTLWFASQKPEMESYTFCKENLM